MFRLKCLSHVDGDLSIDPLRTTPQSLYSGPPDLHQNVHIKLYPGMVRKGVLTHDEIMQMVYNILLCFLRRWCALNSVRCKPHFSSNLFLAGNGKTFYIRREMKKSGPHAVLVVNEGFKVHEAIKVLQTFRDSMSCSIHVNITSVMPSTVSDGKSKYAQFV